MVEVLQVSPLFFSDLSLIGGGERYVDNVCRAVGTTGDGSIACSVVSFGAGPRGDRTIAGAPYHILAGSPSDPRSVDMGAYDVLVEAADVVHVHQCLTEFGTLLAARARLAGRPVIGSDHGGGLMPALVQHPRLHRIYSAFLAYSTFGCSAFQASDVPVHRILGPVDDAYFTPDPSEDRSRTSILAVGRLLPHKGFDAIIDALPAGLSLTIAGRNYDAGYRAFLAGRASGKDVTFAESLSDAELLTLMRRAGLFVHFSQHTDCNGAFHAAPELLGLAPLEALCTGLPTIVSPAGALRELGALPGCRVARDGAQLAHLLARWAADGLQMPTSPEISRAAGERYGLAQFGTAYADVIASL